MAADQTSQASKALRKLYAKLTRSLEPDTAADFLSENLITAIEKEKIDAGSTRTEKNTRLLDALRRRDNLKAIKGIIKVLEGEKAANEEILRDIAAEFPPYSYETGIQETDQPIQSTGEVHSATKPSLIPRGQTLIPRGQTETAEPAPVFVEVEGLPRLKPSISPKDTDLTLTGPAQFISPHQELTDGGGKKRDAYPMNSVPRGYCVIVNNTHFTTMKDRAGSHLDAEELKNLFGTHLGFHIERFEDLDSGQIIKLMENIQHQDHSKLSCLVVAILTHGINGQIYGTDGRLVKVDDITKHFMGTACPTLGGKPKVFILQACRGGTFDQGVIVEQTDSGKIDDEILDQEETDGGGYELALPNEADFVLAYATTPGFVSWRNSAFGTWFIKALTDTMYEKAKSDHFMDMLTEVNRKVAEEYESRGKQKQMPQPVTMLRYKLYFPPV